MFCPTHVCTIVILLTLISGTARPEAPAVRLQKGIYQEETAGNLDQAMQIYRSIVEEQKANRPVAAQALYRLGECHAKKGEIDEAVTTFGEVSSLFPEQKEIVAKAQKRMAAVRQDLSEAQVARIVDKAVKAISTRPEGDPVVSENVQSLHGLNESAAVEALVGHLGSDTDNIRRAAIYLLWQAGFDKIDAAVEPLGKLCSHEEDLTRGMAALALGAHQAAPAYDAIAQMTVSDKSPYARRAAAYALGLMKDPRAVEVLQKATNDSEQLVRANARTALQMLAADEQSEAGPPNVIRTQPAAMANDVDPALKQITVTFDQPMTDGSWSWTGGGDTFPKVNGQISYDEKRTTCRLPVELQPSKVYWIGINSPSHQNFKSQAGVPAVRYAILFATRSADGKPTPLPEDAATQARAINDAADAAKEAVKKAASAPAGSPAAIANRREIQARKLIDRETLLLVNKYDQMFAQWFRPETAYEGASPGQRKMIVQRWIADTHSTDRNTRARAIASLGNVRASEAVGRLLQIAQEENPDNRARWVAVRGLGRIGDTKAVPVLIDMVDHGNENTRVYARLALAQITGVYYGTDKVKWREWKPGKNGGASTQAGGNGRIRDNIDRPFVNDAAVIGKWGSVDFVKTPEQFKPGEKQWKGDLYLKQLSFLAGGRTAGPWKWTQGLLIHPGDQTAAKYVIKEMNGATYLFVEWKSGDYTIRHQEPWWYVLQKQ